MRDILRLLVSARASTDTGAAAATPSTGARGGGAGRRYHSLFRGQEDEEEEDADGLTFAPVREPQPRGTELLQGGEFGRVGAKREAGRGAERHIARVLRQRAQGRRPVYKEDVASVCAPACVPHPARMLMFCAAPRAELEWRRRCVVHGQRLRRAVLDRL
jgi:hypothetical protein